MNNTDLLGGIFLVAIGIFFGTQAMRYNIGQLGAIGPGLFPLVVSFLVVSIGVLNIVRSRFGERIPSTFNVRGIVSIIGAIVAFVLLSKYGNMIAGIVALVFCASLGASSFSLRRNVAVSLALIAIAFAFQRLFQLDLPLY